jgi:hypothetical protein
MPMKKLGMVICIAAGMFALIAPAFPEASVDQGRGQAIVTVLPQKDREAPANILQRDLQVKVNGKESRVTDWVPLRGPNSDLELVILIDGSARASLGPQLGDVDSFIRSLPADVKVSIGYMNAGRAVLAGPLSTNHPQVTRELHLPGGVAGSSGSPYFCLSDLAQHWPSTDLSARREVVLITDGIDNYYPRFNPDDPYVQAAITDSVRSGLVVYSIYWRDRGRRNNSAFESYDGQSLLAEVTQATGGCSYWEGIGEPVSFNSYFDDIAWRLQNQYRLSFSSRLKGKPEIRSMALAVSGLTGEVYAPQRVLVAHSNGE